MSGNSVFPQEPTMTNETFGSTLPGLNLAAMPGQRLATLELAREIERRGFAGISVASPFGTIGQCAGLAFATQRISFASAIAPIYGQTVEEFAQSAAYLHEVSAGRFQFGIGIAHGPAHVRMGVTPGKPLGDIRAFVTKFRACTDYGPLPPVILATLRKRMVALAGEIGDGMLFSSGCLSHMAESLGVVPAVKRDDPAFFIGNRLRVCIDPDPAAAKAVLRKAMSHYALMPNYRNYWIEAGYADEMQAVAIAVAENRLNDVARCLSDRLLADTTLSGTATQVREGVEAWRAAGIKTPVLVPLAADGSQVSALRDVFAAFAG
jgi:alkanesulfonate monooxygenase SsuD/methylene tetrahydromethanopterin reductase-like flavin-dependent oxidoreductase (luciferase family)